MATDSNNDEGYKRLINSRRANRAVATKLSKQIEDIIQDIDGSDIVNTNAKLYSLESTLKEKQTVIADFDAEVLSTIHADNIDREIDEATEWQVKIREVLNKIEMYRKGEYRQPNIASGVEASTPAREGTSSSATPSANNLVPTLPVPLPPSSIAPPDSLNQSIINSEASTNGIRLPKIDLMKFRGDITRFNSFWQGFECTIHKNNAISDAHKLSYLMSLLEGPAYNVVAGLDLTVENYKHAIDTLKSRFGNKQKIVDAHMQELLKLQECPNENVMQLRRIYDSINVNVRGLQSLGMPQESYGSLLVSIIMKRMPKEVTVQVARKISDDIWQLKDILEIIRSEIEALEMCASVRAAEKKGGNSSQHPKSQITGTTRSFLSKTDRRTSSCYFCRKEHLSIDCKEVTNVNTRREMLLKARRCFLCLKLGHKVKECPSDRKCRRCGGAHHQTLCFKGNQDVQTVKEEASRNTITTATVAGRKTVLLQTAKAYVYGEDENNKTEIFILFDGGSQRSYVTDNLKKKLHLKAENVEMINLNTFGSDNGERRKCESVKLNVEIGIGCQPISLNALSFPKICSPLLSRVDVGNYAHLRGLNIADSVDGELKQIDMLIGADFYHDFVLGEVIKGSSGPVAIRSKLGWLLSGPCDSDKDINTCANTSSILAIDRNTQVFDIVDSELDEHKGINESKEIADSLKTFWWHESLGVLEQKEPNSQGEERLEEFDIKFNGSRYEVSLPWRNDICDEPLTSNYDICEKRLRALQVKLKNDPELLHEYNAILQQQLQDGIIELVPESEKVKVKEHFICHHAVIRKDHDTTKLRIVFDASAKAGPDGLSLNDRLEVGENYMPSLFETILRFRSHPIAITADIEKAFLQIEIDRADRDVLRFLWFDDINKANPSIVQLRWCRLAFGLRPAPSILGATIRKHVSMFKEENPEVAELLSRLYADDLSCSVDTVEKGLEIYSQSKEIMSKGSFNLRKFRTNNPYLLKQFHKFDSKSATEEVVKKGDSQVSEDDQSFTQYSVGPPSNDQNAKVLGVPWNTKRDKLFLNLMPIRRLVTTLPPTKRSLLKIAASIFDPLGFLSLFTVNLKVLFQNLCFDKVGWDEELTGKNRKDYESLLSNLTCIDDIQVERCLLEKDKAIAQVEIHAFSDASEQAFATVVYLRVVYESGEVSVRFLASKAKVAPLKKHSIPRLELMGAHLMAKLVESVRSTLKDEFKDKQINAFYWVDSIATLCWVKNPKVWKQFVRHRVSDILKFSSRGEWFHCPGILNPADLPSRGNFNSQLRDNLFWWEGPGFLKAQKCEWPFQKGADELENNDALKEKVKYETAVTHAMVSSDKEIQPKVNNILDIFRYSTKGKLLRVLAWVQRFVSNLKAKVRIQSLNLEPQLNVPEIKHAETSLIQSIQSEAFKREIEYLSSASNKDKRAPIYVTQFNLFLDKDKLLRGRTRICKSSVIESGKHPILLPSHDYFSQLVIKDCHERVFHNGVRETLNLVRQLYWIPKGREMTKKFVRHCVLCKKLEGLPFKTIFAPDLPLCRVEESPPFANTGVDFAGPLFLSNETKNSKKYYVCLFTCMTTRAIHLELVETLSVESFLCAFRRLVGRRGLPEKMLSDNAKTFKSAAKEVNRLLTTPRLFETLTRQGVRWQFITERSPWEGGAWERMVRSVKRCIVKVVGRAMLSFNEMSTILVEIEGVINSRPITYVHDDSEGVSYPLTPSHLINGRNLAHLPHNRYYELISTYETLSNRAKYNRLLLSHFTKRWKNEYLLGLMEACRPRSQAREPVISTGDIVLIKNEQTKRSFWKLGKIVELFPGTDGSIRSAKVQIVNDQGKYGTQVLNRPLKLLVPLEIRAPAQAPLPQASAQITQAQPKPVSETPVAKLRRSAAVISDIRRKDGHWK